MSKLVRWMDTHLYPSFHCNWDDELLREAILMHLKPEHTILDLGAGAGIVNKMNFRGMTHRVCGVDPDERVLQNPFLDEGRIGVGQSIPYPDANFDLVFSDNLLEHLSDPGDVFCEVARVLKPGGIFLSKTPNKFHYVPMIAMLTPHRFHRWVNSLRGRSPVDTFPTRYRANTPAKIAHYSRAAGLHVQRIKLIEGRPEYLRMSSATYVIGCMYERFVNSTDRLACLRVLLMVQLVKPNIDSA